MAVLSMCSSKGGSGKTTIAQLIIGVMRQRGYSVAAIDGDVNQTLSTWLKTFAKLDVDCRTIDDENDMIEQAQELEQKHDVVVIDTAGARNQATLYAIGVSDLVLIPVQLSSANVIEAVKTYRTVENAAKLVKREVPGRVVFTDYTPKTNIAKHIKNEVKDVGLPAMKTKLHRLVAFQELSYGTVPRIGKAGAQAQLLVDEMHAMGVLPFMDTAGVTVSMLKASTIDDEQRAAS